MTVEAITLLAVFLFGLPTLLYLARPILAVGRGATAITADDMEVQELMTERERSYTALADLDFDFECGKISDGDYRQLRGELMREAAQVLARIDGRIAVRQDRPRAEPTAMMTDDALEREIQAFKQAREKDER